jgi:phytoene dehydrogenase-like protein
MTHSYDVIIVGGGHNGLVCASYLGKAGRKVVVLERRPGLGGASTTEEFAPGFKASSVADGAGRLFPEIVRDLDLARYGLQIMPSEQVLTSLQADGPSLTIWRDMQKTVEEIGKFSKADAARYPEFVTLINKVAGVVAGLMRLTPPDLPDVSRGDVMGALKLISPARRLNKAELGQVMRMLPMPISDLLDEWFESPLLKAAFAADGVHGLSFGPKQSGTSYVWLTSLASGQVGGFPHLGMVKGGMGGLVEALAQAARADGVEIRTGAAVVQVVVKDNRAVGVALESGEEITAPIIISSADPRTTFSKLLDPLDVDSVFLRETRNIKYRGVAARLHLALTGLPKFSTTGVMRIAPSVNYLERASDSAKYGQFSAQPYLDVTVPTLVDSSLAPEGQHVLSIYAQYAPYHLRGTTWAEQRGALEKAILDTLSGYAPDVKALIAHSQLLTPLDLETLYGLPEGSGTHGEMTLDQFMYMRPVPGFAQYQTPIAGLYLCGVGTHPGGGVNGKSGQNAARAILKHKAFQ